MSYDNAPSTMSENTKTKRRSPSNAEVPALLKRLIDEVAHLRQDQIAAREEYRQHLFGSEGQVGLSHELRGFRQEQAAVNEELKKSIAGCVRRDEVEKTAQGVKWVWAVLAGIGSAIATAVAVVKMLPR